MVENMRKNRDSAFKAEVALEALKGARTMAALAGEERLIVPKRKNICFQLISLRTLSKELEKDSPVASDSAFSHLRI